VIDENNEGVAKMAAAKQAKLSAQHAFNPASRTQSRTPQDMGAGKRMNRTGAMAAPLRTKQQVKDAARIENQNDVPPADVHLYCAEEEKTFGLMGTMPPPTSLKGLAKSMLQAATGQKATVLLDKLGERLAFERTGTRLYDGLLAKLAAKGGFDGGPTAEDLMKIREDELSHFHTVVEAVRKLGGDPTALTPSANVAAVTSRGVLDVIADPRSTLPEALCAIHVAELTDGDGWRMLIELVQAAGHEDVADDFLICEANEAEHLAHVRRWLSAYAERSLLRLPMETAPMATADFEEATVP
jgi:hypothetical protein